MRRILGCIGLAMGVIIGGGAAPAAAGDADLRVVLDGASEVPGPGDPDATGRAIVTIDDAADTICLTLRYFDVDGNLTGLHIHAAPFNAAGPVVVGFAVPAANGTGITKQCVVGADEALLDKIAAKPSAYYVNLHSDVYPAGAIRAQLGATVK